MRSNEDAASEIASELRRRFGYDLYKSEIGMKWLAAVIGEVRAEVVEPSLPPHVVAARWSKPQEPAPPA